MNIIDFNKNNFPITTNVLDFLQTQMALIEKIVGIIPGNYIITGCVKTGSTWTPGYVVADGQIMYFEGGDDHQYVAISATPTTIVVQDADYTKTIKTLHFGTTGYTYYEWSTFKTAWSYISPANGSWITLTSTEGELTGYVKYSKDTQGIVHVKGYGLTRASGTSNATAYTFGYLPVNYRPYSNPIAVLMTDNLTRTKIFEVEIGINGYLAVVGKIQQFTLTDQVAFYLTYRTDG